RPNSPLGELPELPVARPLVVDEAYYEYCGETALPLIEDGDVIVLRTFSKAFALAGARVGYALSSRELARELYARQAPAPVTRLSVRLGLDGASRVSVQTGAGIYDHFLEQLAFHAGLDLIVEGTGDLETGDHHTVEDTALAFGESLDRALGDRRGIARYGDAVVPMDDALARAAVDLGGRPFAELSFETEPGLADHFFTSLAQAA